MLIDEIFPQVVEDKSTLPECLEIEAKAQGFSDERTGEIVSIVPEPLINSECFLDKMTGLWRYEYGLPYKIAGDLVWGTHMWVPVKHLFAAIFNAYLKLPKDKRDSYVKRLADPDKHKDTLVEMIPVCNLDSAVSVDFEVPGRGVGERTIDWVISSSEGRTVLLDVKRRTVDLIKQMEQTSSGGVAPEPEHDPAILFRSVEQKFASSDSNSCLQGVWIVTDIKQNEEELHHAFDNLDSSKVHFAILGDWKPDVYALVRRPEDRQYLLDLFHVEESFRFIFTRNNNDQSCGH